MAGYEDQLFSKSESALIVSVIALVVSIILASFTGYQAYIVGDTAKRQLRAYVHAVPGNVYHIDGKSGPLQAYVGIRNAGQTFALNVERSIGIEIFRPEIPDKISDFVKLEHEPGKFVIGPGGANTTIRNFRQLTPGEVEQVKAEQGQRIYVVGKLTYEDVWGTPHRTDFCFMYYGYEHAPHPDPSLGRLYLDRQGKYCDKHNSAD